MGDPESVARAICLRALTGAPKTRKQLADLLARRDVPEEAAVAVLDRFTEVGLIDDAAFARAWVSSRQAGRGLARRALQAELRAKGVDGEVAAEAAALVDDDDERAAARDLVQPPARRHEPARPRHRHPPAARHAGPQGLRRRYGGGRRPRGARRPRRRGPARTLDGRRRSDSLDPARTRCCPEAGRVGVVRALPRAGARDQSR